MHGRLKQTHRNDVHYSAISRGQPSDLRELGEISDFLDGQLQAVEGQEGREVGSVEGGHDHDEQPPGREQDAG